MSDEIEGHNLLNFLLVVTAGLSVFYAKRNLSVLEARE